MSTPPPPSRSRALIVGLGAYDALGKSWRLDGSIEDALRLRDVLHVDFCIPLNRITLFLAPTDSAQLAALGALEFSRDELDKYLEKEIARDPEGGTLLVCWSGHGCYTPHDNVLHLISPDATAGQLRSIDFQRLANMLIGKPFAHFSHQVLLVSTCRSPIDAAAPNALSMAVAAPDPLRAVRQCQLYACAEGQTARQTAGEGSLLVREVVAGLRQAATAQRAALAPAQGCTEAVAQALVWPDFVALAVQARDAVLQASGGLQSPAVFATGWDRGTLAGPAGPATPPLVDSLRALKWPPQRLAQQALRCLGADSAWPDDDRLGDLQGLVAFLDDQPQARGWPPLTEFVHRLLAAGAQSTALQRWLDLHSSADEQKRVADFCAHQRLGHVLQIWHDAIGHSLKAALFDADNHLLADAWDKDSSLPLEPGGPQAAIGAWIERARLTLRETAPAPELPLVLELCVPRDWLAQDLDRATVPVSGRNVVLNQDLAALLRCSDRLKVQDTLSTLNLLAPGVLARAVRSSAVVRWADPGDDRSRLLRGLFKPQDDVPAWIGLRPPADPQSGPQWQICLDGLAPALFWLRPDVAGAGRAAVEAELSPLLRQAAGDLPQQLLAWRHQQIGCDSEHVALLIDDPRRPPRWTDQLGRSLPTLPRGPAT
ncbi:hypothetical protein BurJ1DRAFT_4887 [Burkholderiales bacterium JOSHI_001]|nr:hypothetical protein BurJ1DRAFT_4887 [Burkholderiales bacterium JOSHI_001]